MTFNDSRAIPNKAFTHAGDFHSDDVFSAAFLRMLNPDIKIERGFEVPENYDGIVFDIGGGEFDHHQVDNEYRENGIPYASFGKLWRAFGNRLVSEKSLNNIDEMLIQGLDESDNMGTYNSLAIAIYSLNPSWNDNLSSDEQFEKAVEMATLMLENTIKREQAKEQAEKIVQQAIYKSYNKEIIILPQFVPSIEYLIPTDAKFVIFPSNRGGYNIQVIPEEKGNKKAKIDFPKEWAGYRDELCDMSNIQGLNFCHNARFLCAAKDLKSAVKTAVTALNNKSKYEENLEQEVKNILNVFNQQLER